MSVVGHRTTNSKTDQFGYWFGQHWLAVINAFMGLFVFLPLIAPLLMDIGVEGPAKVIYWAYSFMCHQLPERSYFLFGPKISYSLSEIQSVWQNTTDVVILRQFIGNPQMGWKMAWSDRMFSMFTSIWVFGNFWSIFKKKLGRLPWWGATLLILPMAIDGTTHLVSDFAGIGQGFRDTNLWLANLTNNTLPSAFYSGDAWGSFNAWMRLISGILFGLSSVWFLYPLIQEWVSNSVMIINDKSEYRRLITKENGQLANLRTKRLQGKMEEETKKPNNRENPHV